MGTFVDLTGHRFGRLTVIERVPQMSGEKVSWVCECDCGVTKTIQRSDLRSGRTNSCGCLRRELSSILHTTHGMSQTSRFYRTWSEIIRRCKNPNCRSYKDYGGRGITVAERWERFENFKDDMYDSYLAHASAYGELVTTIERIDVESGYSPGNVCWIEKAAQAINTRATARAIGVKEKTNGRWEAYIRRRGKRFSRTFSTKEQALDWRSGVMSEYTLVLPTPPKPEQPEQHDILAA